MRSGGSGGSGRRRWLVLAGAVLAIAGLVWYLLASAEAPQPRARQYLTFTACLLTDDHGIAGQEAKPVWDGMQDASLATHAKVQYLSVAGPQTVDNARPFLASLAQGHCDVVLAVGDAPVAAATQDAATFPDITFIVVGAGADSPGVTAVNGSSSEVRASVAHMVTSAVNTRPRR